MMSEYYRRKLTISDKSSNVETEELLANRINSADNITEIPRLDGELLPKYWQFFDFHLLPNKPCVFTGICAKWQCSSEWVMSDGSPNFKFIKHAFGGARVPVADCGNVKYDAHTKEDMTLADFIDYWEDHRHNGYPDTSRCLYLKDWHFIRDFPDYEAYSTPEYFCSDWLNEFWDTKKELADDYRFVYMGPKGSWTPFHADVFWSHSWSANICGRKKWIFYPPGEEVNLKDRFGHMALDVTSDEMSDKSKYPMYELSHRRIEVIQEAGEVIFVPSSWYHQVHNLEDTISINHNWLNGCNVDLCWKHIKGCLGNVQREIMDCLDMDGWHQHCQVILKACNGIDYAEFIQFMEMIGTSRLQSLKNMESEQKNEVLTSKRNPNLMEVDKSSSQNVLQYNDSQLERVTNAKHSDLDSYSVDLSNTTDKSNTDSGLSEEKLFSTARLRYQNHLLFDLRRIKHVLEDALSVEEIHHIDLSTLNHDIQCFLQIIITELNKY